MAQGGTVIRPGDTVATFVDLFDVEPGRQRELVDVLVAGAERAVRHRPGVVSANILASADGTRVLRYAQRRAPDDVTAAMADPDVQQYATRAATARAASLRYPVAAVARA